jgi:hypothetical protein
MVIKFTEIEIFGLKTNHLATLIVASRALLSTLCADANESTHRASLN